MNVTSKTSGRSLSVLNENPTGGSPDFEFIYDLNSEKAFSSLSITMFLSRRKLHRTL